jgi:hypothetical protein
MGAARLGDDLVMAGDIKRCLFGASEKQRHLRRAGPADIEWEARAVDGVESPCQRIAEAQNRFRFGDDFHRTGTEL